MTFDLNAESVKRAQLITKSLTRHRLVFVQIGAAFEPIREGIVGELKGILSTIPHRADWQNSAEEGQTLVITDLEQCVHSEDNILGAVRETILALLDSGKMVCLISRAPRISYKSVPGSSVLEDAALVTLPLMTRDDLPASNGSPHALGWEWPSVAFGAPFDVGTLQVVLSEVGHGLVAALDHALFEVDPSGTGGLSFLAARELEGLRGSGIVKMDLSGNPSLAVTRSKKILCEALAAHVSETVEPASIFPGVAAGLWFIERKIRHALRKAAIQKYENTWRSSSVGGMKVEILRRAQLDTNVTAKSVEDLRDPLEWLTLGELMDIVRGPKFEGLGQEAAIWRKLQEQLVPIRNRLAHVRMLLAEDEEVVTMWASLIRSRFGA